MQVMASLAGADSDGAEDPDADADAGGEARPSTSTKKAAPKPAGPGRPRKSGVTAEGPEPMSEGMDEAGGGGGGGDGAGTGTQKRKPEGPTNKQEEAAARASFDPSQASDVRRGADVEHMPAPAYACMQMLQRCMGRGAIDIWIGQWRRIRSHAAFPLLCMLAGGGKNDGPLSTRYLHAVLSCAALCCTQERYRGYGIVKEEEAWQDAAKFLRYVPQLVVAR